MNNLVNIAEFSKKQTHQKHITWKATLYKNYNWIMDALFSSYQAI